jgi:hypothetical protein
LRALEIRDQHLYFLGAQRVKLLREVDGRGLDCFEVDLPLALDLELLIAILLEGRPCLLLGVLAFIRLEEVLDGLRGHASFGYPSF